MYSCPLCKKETENSPLRGFYACFGCNSIFRSPDDYLTWEEEKKRYELHENDSEDPGYQRFVAPIVQAVLKDFKPGHLGLDFGAGTGPVIFKILSEQGYIIKLYDPFFHSHPEYLEQTYDFIVCCEVIEHFYDPYKEFALLRKLLKPGGRLYCMTHLYADEVSFEKWYYKGDPTHVFFYRVDTLEWIKEQFQFHQLWIKDRLIILEG